MKIHIALFALLAINLCSVGSLSEDNKSGTTNGKRGSEISVEENDPKFNLYKYKKQIESNTGKKYILLKPISYSTEESEDIKYEHGTLYHIKLCATDTNHKVRTLQVTLYENPEMFCGMMFLELKKLWRDCSAIKPD